MKTPKKFQRNIYTHLYVYVYVCIYIYILRRERERETESLYNRDIQERGSNLLEKEVKIEERERDRGKLLQHGIKENEDQLTMSEI